MKTTFFLLPIAAVGLSLSSCVVPVDSYYGAPGYGYYATLPVGYVGDYYLLGGRYYYGGRYEHGHYYYNGRHYDGRYFHNGHCYYGGNYGHHSGHHH